MNEQLRRAVFELKQKREEVREVKLTLKSAISKVESMYPLKELDRFDHRGSSYFFSHAEYRPLLEGGKGVYFHVHGFKIKKNGEPYTMPCYVKSEVIEL